MVAGFLGYLRLVGWWLICRVLASATPVDEEAEGNEQSAKTNIDKAVRTTVSPKGM
jgi:hypothetical protein